MNLIMFRSLLAGMVLVWSAGAAENYVGSGNCRECHERFYGLWSTSFHGLALRPYSPAFAQEHLTVHEADIVSGGVHYRAHVDTGAGGCAALYGLSAMVDGTSTR